MVGLSDRVLYCPLFSLLVGQLFLSRSAVFFCVFGFENNEFLCSLQTFVETFHSVSQSDGFVLCIPKRCGINDKNYVWMTDGMCYRQQSNIDNRNRCDYLNQHRILILIRFSIRFYPASFDFELVFPSIGIWYSPSTIGIKHCLAISLFPLFSVAFKFKK